MNEKQQSKAEDKSKPPSATRKRIDKIMDSSHLSWIKPRLGFNSLKPVIRMALSVSPVQTF